MTYEEYLEENGKLTYSNVGVSMLPLLRQGRDLFTVEKNDGKRFKKYDVVLYRRYSSKKNRTEYVLHRIVGVRPDSYVIIGDNCVNYEYGIRDCDILGRMVSITREGGRVITADSFGFRAFSVVWVRLAPVRIFLKKARMRFRRVVRKVLQ